MRVPLVGVSFFELRTGSEIIRGRIEYNKVLKFIKRQLY